jgi:hypothetical protein
MNDYRVKITIRNDRILSKIEELGYVSVLQFCKQNELQYQHTSMIISGKVKPFLEKKKTRTINKYSQSIIAGFRYDCRRSFYRKTIKRFC